MWVVVFQLIIEFNRISQKDLIQSLAKFFKEYIRALTILVNTASATKHPLEDLLDELLSKGSTLDDTVGIKEKMGTE